MAVARDGLRRDGLHGFRDFRRFNDRRKFVREDFTQNGREFRKGQHHPVLLIALKFQSPGHRVDPFILEKHDHRIRRQCWLIIRVMRAGLSEVDELQQAPGHRCEFSGRVPCHYFRVDAFHQGLEFLIRHFRQALVDTVTANELRKILVVDASRQLAFDLGNGNPTAFADDVVEQRPLGTAQIVELKMNGFIQYPHEFFLGELILLDEDEVDLPLEAGRLRMCVREPLRPDLAAPFVFQEFLHLRAEIRLESRMGRRTEDVPERDILPFADRLCPNGVEDLFDLLFKDVPHVSSSFPSVD